ncbi:MAG: protein-glutamate O-methyltransferase CheR [Acidobacteriaceae bacterium]
MTLAAQDVEFLRELVARNSGNQLDSCHDYLFESRLQHLVRAQGFSSVAGLVAALRLAQPSSLERSVAEAMTINETSFFREPAAFDLLRDVLLPALLVRRRDARALRFWSAACSSGQEAYSLAMLLGAHFPQLASWSIDILGTDLSAGMIARAAAGRYSRMEIDRGLSPDLISKYLAPAGDEWEVSPALRSLCRFQRRNLCSSPPLPRACDVIFLRNLLLYFPPATRNRVLRVIHRSLAPDGILFLGASEQLPNDSQHWKAMLAPKAVWYCPLPCR